MIQPALTFVIYQQGLFARRETIQRGVIRIGRHSGNHLSLDDAAVAERHALIEIDGAKSITLSNLGGESTLAVNGRWVDEVILAVGDRITVGSSELLLEEVVAESAALAPTRTQQGVVVAANQNGPAVAANQPGTPPLQFGSIADHGLAQAYAMLKRGPAVRLEEVELPHVTAAEVSIAWGENVLHVAHLVPPRNFYVGDEQDPTRPFDFLIPREKLGVAHMPLLLCDESGIWVVIPPLAMGYVDTADGTRLSLAAARAHGIPCAQMPGAVQLALGVGTRAYLQLADITFRVGAVRAGKPMARGLFSALDATALGYLGLSALSVGGLLSSMAFLVPPLGLSGDEDMSPDRLYLLQQYLAAASEREQKPAAAPLDSPTGGESAPGARADGAEGAMGAPDTAQRDRRYAIAGTADRTEQRRSSDQQVREARDYGIISLLNSGLLGDPAAPTAVFGADIAVGSDAVSAQGNLWGDDLGRALGAGGLALSDAGDGGGGRTDSIGLREIGTIGHDGNGEPGMGFDRGRPSGSHRTSAPRLRMGQVNVSGRLPPQTIQRVVRQNFARLRSCYEHGLLSNPGLTGRVGVRFVIGRDGAVANVANVGSDLPDPKVIDCVSRAFYDITFPKPEGGVVSVTYPIVFQPD